MVEWHETASGAADVTHAKQEMALHDALPPLIRSCLAELPVHLDAGAVLNAWLVARLLGETEEQFVGKIEKQFKKAA